MNVIDEDRLRALLREATDDIAVPDNGTDRILSATATANRRDPLVRSLVPHSNRGRIVLVAAVVVAVVGGVTLVDGSLGTPSRQVTAGRTPAAPPGSHASSGSGTSAGTAQGTFASPGIAGIAGSPNAHAAPLAPTPTTPPTSLPPGIVGQSAKVVTTGTIDLAIGTGSLGAVVTKLTDLAVGVGGFVARSQLQIGSAGSGSSSSGTLVLQVPQPAFASLLAQVQGVAKVTSVTSTSTDVTGQYVDLQARINALQASRQQYLTILSKATSIGDILAVQSQLDSLQSQIEQLQGQLNLLDSQTSYATLTVSLSEAGHPPPPPAHPRSGLSSAWHDSISGFVSGFEWLLRIAGPTLFVLLCLAVLVFAARWAWRAARRRML